MAIRNALPFEFPYRWPDLRRFFGKVSDEGADFLDQRDRDLEDFLAGLGGGGGATLPFFVAASDASDESKALAAYTCDGTDDHLTIQSAVDDINAAYAAGTFDGPGAAVWLSEGTFSIGGSVNLDSSSTGYFVSVRGMGPSSTFLVEQAVTPTATALDLDLRGDGQVIEGILFVGLSKGIHTSNGIADYIRIRNCGFDGCASGIYLEVGNQVMISDNHFDACDYGVYIAASSKHLITGNHFFDSQEADIYGVELTDCTITGNKSASSEKFVFVEGFVSQSVISNNAVNTPASGGIVLSGAGPFGADDFRGVDIIGNNIRGSGGTEIDLDDFAVPSAASLRFYAAVHNNQIDGSALIDVPCFVTGNDFVNGLVVDSSVTVAVVSNNILGDSTRHGGAPTQTLTDNTSGSIVETGAGNYLDGTWT